MFDILFTPRGQKDLNKLPKDLQIRVVNKLQFFASQENPLVFSKTLVDLPPTTHRFRIGNYRVAFYIAAKTICVDRIRHRKEVYLR